MLQYDLRELLNSVTAESVAEYIGLEIQSHGKRKEILCPNPEHNDHHFGSCILLSQGYMCYACGATGGLIDLVKKSMQVGTGEAIRIIAESTGEPSLFLLPNNTNDGNSRPPPVRILTDDKLELIGLAPARSKVWLYTSAYEADEPRTLKKNEREEWLPGDDNHGDYVVIARLIDQSPIKTLAREEPIVYRKLICDKAEEAIENYWDLYGLVCSMADTSHEFKALMMQSIQSIITEIEDILIDHGGKIKQKKHVFGKLKSSSII